MSSAQQRLKTNKLTFDRSPQSDGGILFSHAWRGDVRHTACRGLGEGYKTVTLYAGGRTEERGIIRAARARGFNYERGASATLDLLPAPTLNLIHIAQRSLLLVLSSPLPTKAAPPCQRSCPGRPCPRPRMVSTLALPLLRHANETRLLLQPSPPRPLRPPCAFTVFPAPCLDVFAKADGLLACVPNCICGEFVVRVQHHGYALRASKH